MTVTITDSVGTGGGNRESDVKAVQQLLNAVIGQLGLAPLVVNGLSDAPTVAAIVEYQRRVLKRASPDGRVDPMGGTLKSLNAASPAAAPPAPASPAPAPAAKGSGTGIVTYSASLPAEMRLVSDYAFKVIEKAVRAAGFKGAVITSTRRLPAKQATLMYDNAAVNLAKQYSMYRENGDKVLKVFENNRGKPRAEVIAMMQRKIEELQAQDLNVSNHVVTLASYAKRNVIDIGVASTQAVAGPGFKISKLTAAFEALVAQHYIDHFVDETTLSNHCWHLEILPDKKPL